MLTFISPDSDSDISKKHIFLEKISRKFPVVLGEQLCWDSNGIYGEVIFPTLADVFQKSREKFGLATGGIFYDLGSGIGKAVISAALLHNFDRCVGIELLPSLHSLALDLQRKYQKNKRKYEWLAGATENVQFFNEDIFLHDWTKASCFFANSTCFDEEMIRKISEYPVVSGTIGITTTKRLGKKYWRLLDTCQKDMTWGKATVYIHKKI